MNENKQGKPTALVLSLGAAALAAVIALLLPAQGGMLQMENEQVSADRITLSEKSEVYQTLTYTRCDHTVTRRITAPVELYGKTLDETAALYPEWRITEFSPAMVKMERRPDLFCPDHRVVMADSTGYLCVYENKYGEAMALVRELNIPLASLPAAAQEEAREGIGFSTPEELEGWLESVES